MTSRGSHDIPDSEISDFPILLSCFKVLLGCNVFLLPLCFKYSGLLWGSIQLIIFGLLFAYCAHTLLSCANFIAARDDISILSYGKLVYLAIKNGPPGLAEWHKVLEVIVRVFQTLYAILICGIYMHIITLHLIQIGYSKTDPIDISIDIGWWNAVTALALFFICFIPSTYLYIFAIIGIICQFSSLIVCYAVYVFTDFKAEPEYFSYSAVSITYTMALATYVFEGINVILPFRNQVQNKIRFTRYVFVVIITITGLSLFVGIFGFIRFDFLVYPCITLHVPANTTAGQVVKCFASLSLLLTYPFQHNVAFVELDDLIRNTLVSQKYARLSELLLQFLLIFFSMLLAACPSLLVSFFILLFGNVYFHFLGVLMPSHIKICVDYRRSGYGPYYWRLILSITVISCSFIIFLYLGIINFVGYCLSLLM